MHETPTGQNQIAQYFFNWQILIANLHGLLFVEDDVKVNK